MKSARRTYVYLVGSAAKRMKEWVRVKYGADVPDPGTSMGKTIVLNLYAKESQFPELT